MLLGKNKGQLLIAPEKLKWMGQSRNDAVVGVFGGESKAQCCKDHYFIRTWNVRFMNQGKLDMVRQKIARVNVNILGINE